MIWQQLLGHHDQVALLRGSIARGRLGQAYLLAGPPGIGKKRFALLLAQSLLCDHCSDSDLDACGVCSACSQVQAGSHPDLIVAELPEGKRALPLELFLGSPERRGKEGLCYELSLRPMSASRKVAIIDDADTLNQESGNALLKTLEEPPPHSLMLLVASSPDVVLPTIRSRCQVLRFHPLAEAEVETLLLREQITDDAEAAKEAALLSDGSLQTAAQLLDPELRHLRQTLYNLLATQPLPAARLARQMVDSLQELGTEAAVQRLHAGWLIRFCLEFYRRALLCLSTGPEAAEGFPQVLAFCRGLSSANPDHSEYVGDLLERVMQAEQQINRNATVALCLESLFEDLEQRGRRQASRA